MDYAEKGSKTYLFTIVLVAVLGGLLFGYDTAVISGAEKGLQAFFLGAEDFVYTDGWHGFTCASALIGCIIGSAVSGYMASNWGRKKSLIFAGIMFFISALGSMVPEFLFFEHGVPTYPLLIAFNIYRVIGGVVLLQFVRCTSLKWLRLISEVHWYRGISLPLFLVSWSYIW